MYGKKFFKRRIAKYHNPEMAIAISLYRAWTPASVLDIGCAIGSYLSAFEECGCDVVGIEPYAKHSIPYAPDNMKNKILDYDAGIHFDLSRTFDLVMSIEVAEHIAECNDVQYVKNIVRHAGNKILITAAKPGQRGTGHINCQPIDYWVDLFHYCGANYNGTLTAEAKILLGDDGLNIADNMIVFRV